MYFYRESTCVKELRRDLSVESPGIKGLENKNVGTDGLHVWGQVNVL